MPPHPAVFGLSLQQPSRGYRFSADALKLADFASIGPGERVADLGSGCGVIALLLAQRHPDITVWGVEIQEELVDLSRQNAMDNGLERRVRFLHRDIRGLTAHHIGGPVDLAVSNPPHIPRAAGRISPNHQIAIARHELRVTLEDIAQTAHRLLKPQGRLILAYPASRTTDLMVCLRAAHIEPKTFRLVYTRPQTPARRILMEGVKGGRPGVAALPPLYPHQGGEGRP